LGKSWGGVSRPDTLQLRRVSPFLDSPQGRRYNGGLEILGLCRTTRTGPGSCTVVLRQGKPVSLPPWRGRAFRRGTLDKV